MNRSEKAIFTNMCMIYDDNGRVLVQDRVNSNWPGVTFPGGHVEKGEPFSHSVIREVYEETGLTIKSPVLCGVKQFQTKDDERYVVLFYKTNQFGGELKPSKEGNVFWIQRDELCHYKLANDFDEMVKVFELENLSEFYYHKEGGHWHVNLF